MNAAPVGPSRGQTSVGEGGSGVTNDDAWVARMARGDQTGLAALYDRYASVLIAIGVRILRSRAEAEDVVHDVFLEAYQRAGDFDPARGSVRGWLCLRMRSRCLDRQKSPRVQRSVPLDDSGLNMAAAAETDPLLRMERERVRKALAVLTTEQRTLVELAYFSGLGMGEIATELGLPTGTVKSRLSAARDKLRTALATADQHTEDKTATAGRST
jgi:RNA polymerase sigma-70 factor (ECF subfamily)